MQKYNYNHERVCEKRKCRKNVGKGKPPPKRVCQNGGSALRAEISQIYPKSFILCISTLIC